VLGGEWSGRQWHGVVGRDSWHTLSGASSVAHRPMQVPRIVFSGAGMSPGLCWCGWWGTLAQHRCRGGGDREEGRPSLFSGASSNNSVLSGRTENQRVTQVLLHRKTYLVGGSGRRWGGFDIFGYPAPLSRGNHSTSAAALHFRQPREVILTVGL
jgi:hypothetical protein